jgi:hypothetical protein
MLSCLARELVQAVRRNVIIDWTQEEMLHKMISVGMHKDSFKCMDC